MFKKLLLLLPLSLVVVAACRPTLPPAPTENVVPEQQVLPAQVATKTPIPPRPTDTPIPDSLTSKFSPEYLNRDRSKGETLPNKVFGPQNKGALVTLKGKKQIKLPSNVYLYGIVVSADCPTGASCYKAPYNVFTTGNSYLGLSDDGKVLFENIVPGEELVFESLKRQLQ